MYPLFKKELTGFFSSLTGYIVIVVFLLSTGLFLWVFPGNMNLLETGYAHLSPFFALAPWIFLFLVPAVSMRLFTEEKKTGTLNLIFTKPISDMKIVIKIFHFNLCCRYTYADLLYSVMIGSRSAIWIWSHDRFIFGLFFLAAITCHWVFLIININQIVALL